jgi:hypothetical protein
MPMTRLLTAVALFVSLALLSASAARAQDKVRYFDRKTQKNVEKSGNVTEESAAGITLKAAGEPKPVAIPAGDISEIDYAVQDGDKFGRIEWNRPNNYMRNARAATAPAKRREWLEKALEDYRTLVPLVKGDKKLTRHVQFSMAEALALEAEADPKQLGPAIEAVKKFKTDHGNGWQLVKATKLLIRLLDQKGDEEGVQAAYAELADNEAAPKDVRLEFGMLSVGNLIRKNKFADAAAKARAIKDAMAPDDPQLQKVKVYLAACNLAAKKLDGVEKELDEVVKSGADSDVKAMARNTLGDYFLAKNDKEKAFWEYLWVDVHYNQDREQLSRALYNLSKLFVEVRQDKVRAKECLDRLSDEKQFGGLEYHRKALAEKAPGAGN